MTQTRQVFCGNVPIGGGAPVSIQSMTNTDTRDANATLEQIKRLTDAGSDTKIVGIILKTEDSQKTIAMSPLRVLNISVTMRQYV